MDIMTNEWVVMGAGWLLFIISELIGASKLESSGVIQLLIQVLKFISGKK